MDFDMKDEAGGEGGCLRRAFTSFPGETGMISSSPSGWVAWRFVLFSDASKVCCFGFLDRAILRGLTVRLLGLPFLGDSNLTLAGDSP